MKAKNDMTKEQLELFLDKGKKKARTGKYNNTKVEIDGEKFDSKAEAARFGELCILQRQNLITDLCRQVRYPLKVNDQLVTTYIADFVYNEKQPGGEVVQIVEDCKGYRTPVYRLKAKLFAAVLGFKIRETS
jgi:hypothetical protein